MWQLSAATSCRLVYHNNVPKSTDGPPVLRVVLLLCLDVSLLTLYSPTSKHKTITLASAALQTTVRNYRLSTRSSPFQISPTRLKLSISHRHQTESCPFVLLQQLHYTYLCLTTLRISNSSETEYEIKRGLDKTALCRASCSAHPVKYYSGDRIKADWV
jgi:hypothetical protein